MKGKWIVGFLALFLVSCIEDSRPADAAAAEVDAEVDVVDVTVDEVPSYSIEEKLVGSWTCLHDGLTIAVNADGTVSGLPSLWLSGPPTNWAAAGNTGMLFRSGARTLFDFYVSTDGQTLIIRSNMAALGIRAFRRN